MLTERQSAQQMESFWTEEFSRLYSAEFYWVWWPRRLLVHLNTATLQTATFRNLVPP